MLRLPSTAVRFCAAAADAAVGALELPRSLQRNSSGKLTGLSCPPVMPCRNDAFSPASSLLILLLGSLG